MAEKKTLACSFESFLEIGKRNLIFDKKVTFFEEGKNNERNKKF